ncbi:beta-lactamase/transpeptidase-like protein [Melanomma pulvis-pyrius CBS 109.77]|uniref:Beta-lactamase/transpeptidase-like protein n=1 Tax=Melanomma pulvis-pyrius CBS 109.77 TaxID=1314802 RepID=A0A6A6WPQ1_9PLEO|nr:beta-lactamase/transpeptidase-like protein [Melanomma pulvis-pyrius CBS 109.77]
MEHFEAKLSRAATPAVRDILGAIAVVVNREGTVYHYATGYQTMTIDSLPVDHDSDLTFMMASAGKFITHIAALQCVEYGLISLDESVHSVLPELDEVGVLSRNDGPEALKRPFVVSPISQKVTLRHLLSHSSGIDYESNPLVQEWRTHMGEEPKADYHPGMSPVMNAYSTPFLYEPGEGWMYGASIEWTAALVSRLTGLRLGEYIKEHIFNPLSMTSSTYHPQENPEICSRILQMVRRDGDRIVPMDYTVAELGLICSASDISKLFVDLLSPKSKLLRKDLQEALFEPQFSPSSAARAAIRRDTEMYAVPAGMPMNMTMAPVNHSLAALVVEEDVLYSGIPAGTVTWNGMPNLIWAMHREKGLAMAFLTQILPVDDEKTVDLAMEFIRRAWRTFG